MLKFKEETPFRYLERFKKPFVFPFENGWRFKVILFESYYLIDDVYQKGAIIRNPLILEVAVKKDGKEGVISIKKSTGIVMKGGSEELKKRNFYYKYVMMACLSFLTTDAKEVTFRVAPHLIVPFKNENE